MSYLETGAIQSDYFADLNKKLTTAIKGAPAPSGTVQKAVQPAVDVIKLWTTVKLEMSRQFGLYSTADGAPAIYKGYAYSRLTFDQAKAIYTFWMNAAAALEADMLRANRPELAGQLSQKRLAYAVEYSRWRMNAIDQYGSQLFQGKYMFLLTAYEFDKITTNFVLWISTLDWSIHNTTSALENVIWAINDTYGPAGPVISKIFKAGYGTAKLIDKLPDYIKDLGEWGRKIGGKAAAGVSITWTLLKWGSIGAAGFFLFRVVQARRES